MSVGLIRCGAFSSLAISVQRKAFWVPVSVVAKGGGVANAYDYRRRSPAQRR